MKFLFQQKNSTYFKTDPLDQDKKCLNIIGMINKITTPKQPVFPDLVLISSSMSSKIMKSRRSPSVDCFSSSFICESSLEKSRYCYVYKASREWIGQRIDNPSVHFPLHVICILFWNSLKLFDFLSITKLRSI